MEKLLLLDMERMLFGISRQGQKHSYFNDTDFQIVQNVSIRCAIENVEVLASNTRI